MSEDRRRRVALVGATGVAGQQFLVSLADHPWFELTTLAASPRSAGKTFTDAIATPGGSIQWGCEEPLPEQFADRVVVDAVAAEHPGWEVVSDRLTIPEPLGCDGGYVATLRNT